MPKIVLEWTMFRHFSGHLCDHLCAINARTVRHLAVGKIADLSVQEAGYGLCVLDRDGLAGVGGYAGGGEGALGCGASRAPVLLFVVRRVG